MSFAIIRSIINVILTLISSGNLETLLKYTFLNSSFKTDPRTVGNNNDRSEAMSPKHLSHARRVNLFVMFQNPVCNNVCPGIVFITEFFFFVG